MSIRYVELTPTRSARVYSARHQRFKLKTITDRKATPFRSCQVGRGFLFPSILYLTESCPLKSVALEKSAVANNSLRAKHLADEDAKPVAGFGPWGLKLKNSYVLALFCDGKNYPKAAVFPPTERTAFWSGKTKTDTSDFQVNKITTSQMVNTVYRTDLLVISDFAVASI